MYRYIWKIELFDPSYEEGFLRHWRENSSILQQYPGAKGSFIHKVRGESGGLFMVAEWESEEARDAMHQDIYYGDSELAKQWRKLPRSETFGKITLMTGTQFDQVVVSE